MPPYLPNEVLNLRRLDAYWNDTPIDCTRTSHLARLDLSHRLAA